MPFAAAFCSLITRTNWRGAYSVHKASGAEEAGIVSGKRLRQRLRFPEAWPPHTPIHSIFIGVHLT